MSNTGSRAEGACPSNISLMCDDVADEFVTDALGQLPIMTGALLVADDLGFLSDLPNQTRLDFTRAGLDDIPIKLVEVSERIHAAVEMTPTISVVIVDMRWGAGTISATANF